MKLLRNRVQRSTLLILSFLILPLLCGVPSGTTSRAQQTSTAGAQATSTATPDARKFIVTVIGPTAGFMTGLTRDSFTVLEGKSQREINYFDSADVPVSVGLMVDVSGSVRRETIEAARRAAMLFIEQSHPENEYFIGEFGGGLRGLTDWTRDPREIAEGLSKLATGNGAKQKPAPRGQTPLYDSCLAALEKLASRTHQKRVLLLMGDAGGDNQSKHSFHDLRRRIMDSDVLVYAINVVESYWQSSSSTVSQTIIDELASLSGGWAYFVDNEKEAKESAKRLAMELRHQYVIGFAPANAARGGKWNKVKIKVTPLDPSFKKVTVRSREGYFSTPLTP